MKMTKLPAATIKVLLALAQQTSARVLLVQECAFLLDGKSHAHKYIPTAAFSILREKEWITPPVERGHQLTECVITHAGRAAAASIQALQNEFHQLEFDLEMIDCHMKATQVEFDIQATATPEPAEETATPELGPAEEIAVSLAEQVRRHMPLTRPDVVRALVYGLPEVSAEQVARCHRIENERGAAYIVESEYITDYRYKVSYTKSGFSCTCTSGQQNFQGVVHPSGVCGHVRWSLAASLEARMHARTEYQDAQEATASQGAETEQEPDMEKAAPKV